METVLIVGATGNIGISAVLATLRTGRKVLAIVRNQASREKLFAAVGSSEGITTVEASVISEHGVQSVVDQVRAGKLPAFQHVYVAAGGAYSTTKLQEASLQELREAMTQNFESNFLAYRATIPYLLEQNNPTSTWTVCTGASGDMGNRAIPSMTQGAVFSLLNSAVHDLEGTNVRLNEVYLAERVEVDATAVVNGTMKASDFSKSYETILSRPEISSCRVYVHTLKDLEHVRYRKRTEAIDDTAWNPKS